MTLRGQTQPSIEISSTGVVKLNNYILNGGIDKPLLDSLLGKPDRIEWKGKQKPSQLIYDSLGIRAEGGIGKYHDSIDIRSIQVLFKTYSGFDSYKKYNRSVKLKNIEISKNTKYAEVLNDTSLNSHQILPVWSGYEDYVQFDPYDGVINLLFGKVYVTLSFNMDDSLLASIMIGPYLWPYDAYIYINDPDPPLDSLKHWLDSINKSFPFDQLAFFYGEKYFINDFQSQFKTINSLDYNTPLNYIGIAVLGEFNINRWYAYPGQLMYTFIIPSVINVNDSIKETTYGFNFKLSLAGQWLVKKRNLRIFLTEGLYAGRLKVIDQDKKRLKNSNQGIFGSLILCVHSGRFSLFAMTELDLDITQSKWQKIWVAKRQNNELPNFNQSAINIALGIRFSPNSNLRRVDKN